MSNTKSQLLSPSPSHLDLNVAHYRWIVTDQTAFHAEPKVSLAQCRRQSATVAKSATILTVESGHCKRKQVALLRMSTYGVGHAEKRRTAVSVARVSLAPLLEDLVWTSLMAPKEQKQVRCLIKYGS